MRIRLGIECKIRHILIQTLHSQQYIRKLFDKIRIHFFIRLCKLSIQGGFYRFPVQGAGFS